MIVVLKPDAPKAHSDEIMARIKRSGCRPLYLPGTERVVIGAIGDERTLAALQLEADPHVESVKPILQPHKLVSREFHPHDTFVDIGKIRVGGDRFVVIAGPAAVESEQQLAISAEAVGRAGGSGLRAGVFCARNDPHAFEGLGEGGLGMLRQVAHQQGLPCLTEVVGADTVDAVVAHADAIVLDQGSMRDFRLLKALGRTDKPVVLERGLAADLEELLVAAEYIVGEGNNQLIFCERGIRTFERSMGATLDLSSVPYLKQRTHLPVMVDVSRSLGRRDLAAPMAKAAAACGADGIFVQVHGDPTQALADGQQSLYPDQFAELMHAINPFIAAAGRTL